MEAIPLLSAGSRGRLMALLWKQNEAIVYHLSVIYRNQEPAMEIIFK